MDHAESCKAAKRVVIIVSKRSPHWLKAWASAEEMVTIALRLMQEQQLIPPGVQDHPSTIRVLAKERWDLRTFIVFDIFHDTYNPDTAHLPGQNDLPVISVFLGKNESVTVAGPQLMNKVNGDIRAIHNATGPGSRPPFVVDHSEGKVPFYPNPRTLATITT